MQMKLSSRCVDIGTAMFGAGVPPRHWTHFEEVTSEATDPCMQLSHCFPLRAWKREFSCKQETYPA